jgi:hypothetical protein
LAVVADEIPSYQEFAGACVLNDWESGLENYISHPELRRKHVGIGQRIIAKKWTVGYIADQWQNVFDKLLNRSQMGRV